ncbi:MAG TPA: amidohydrolase family protein [Stellaceae bacterium]|nr:amidohydrolase family protein [Stellaceae bacterium]
MKVVDVHCHIVPADFPAVPPSCGAAEWPVMENRDNAQRAMMVGGKEMRVVDNRAWDAARRIADMDGEDVGMQAVSPMPEILSYWIDAKAALVMARYINETIATLVRKAPERFTGLGMVPLQDPELAAKELAALRNLGLAGVEIGSNINHKSPGEAFFDPFFAEAERLGLAIFIHALHPTMTDRLVGPRMIAPYIAYPTDIGLAGASLITGRVLEKFPKLRIGLSHGGGTLAAFLPRLESGWQKLQALNRAFASPVATARRLYYDNVVFDKKLLRHLIDTFGDTQIFVGSDYPFTAGQKNSAAMFEGLGLEPWQLDALRGGNAARFLGLDKS